MSLSLVTAPATLPLGLNETLAHLRLDHGLENDYVSGLIASVASYLDGPAGVLGRCLISQQWNSKLDEFPASSGVIDIPLPPLVSVDLVTYIDSAGVIQTLSAAKYRTIGGAPFAGLVPVYGEIWPGTRAETEAVTIRFTAGYGTAADVPAAIRAAMLLLVGHFYNNREDSVIGLNISQIPNGSGRLLSQFIVRNSI